MVRIIEISQCHGGPIIAYSSCGKERILTRENAVKVVQAAKRRFDWYFCPFDDVILDYRFKR